MPYTMLDWLWEEAMGSVPAKTQKPPKASKNPAGRDGVEDPLWEQGKKEEYEGDEETEERTLEVLSEEEITSATATESVTGRAPPPRWRKRDFATRIKRNWFPGDRKPKTTYETLPKFQGQEQQQAVKREAVVPADEVRQLVSRLVLRERGLVDVVLVDYNSFLEEVTRAGALFTHEYENEHGRHEVRLADVSPGAVRHGPLRCRQEERCYALPLTVLASYRCLDEQGTPVRAFTHRMALGEVPLMVGSRLCPTTTMTAEERVTAGQQPDEPGGYFIVDGIEKFIPFRNVRQKNLPLVMPCRGQDEHRFSHKCRLLSSVSETESCYTAVLASRRDTLQVRLRLGSGGFVVLPLGTVLAATGVQGQLEARKEAESLQFLRRTLTTVLPSSAWQRLDKRRQAPMTSRHFRGRDGGTSPVAMTILDYLVSAQRLLGVTQQDLQRIHGKCEASKVHHAALLRIAAEYVRVKEEEEMRQREARTRLAALRDVMLQGCEDVPRATKMAQAALTLPAEGEARRDVLRVAKVRFKAGRLNEVLKQGLLPHVRGDLPRRAFYLAYMTNQLLLTLCGRRAADDPLHLANRRLVTPGALIKRLFDAALRSVLQRARKTILCQYEKPRAVWSEKLDHVDLFQDDPSSPHIRPKQRNKVTSEKFDLLSVFQFQHNVVGEEMFRALRRGKWGEGRRSMAGVTQTLERLNYMQYLSQMRTVSGEDTLLDGKGPRPHELHVSTVGFLCPIETPENENVGLTKHLALGASVCSKVDATHLQELLQSLPVTLFEENHQWPSPDRLGKVFVDGCWVGNAEAPVGQVREQLLQHRRSLGLHFGVHRRYHDLYLDASGGRPVRPLLVACGGALTAAPDDLAALRCGRCSLDQLWRRGVVDFLDPQENSEAFIAEQPLCLGLAGVNHCQLQAMLSHGVVSAATPAAANNPGVRRLGSCKMQKQAIGPPVVSEVLAHRGTYSVLKTPEVPLALPAFVRDLPNARLMYAGQSALTAVLAVRGLNQEDGLVLSRGAVDRGLFTSRHSHRYRKYEPHLGTAVKGRAEVGRRVAGGTVLIACKDKRDNVRAEDRHCPSEVVHSCAWHLPDGRVRHEVVTLEERQPEVGDKLGMLNGQKGVICGILPDHQLPRLEDGRTPDIFISPHSFLDRQTVGFFVEGLLNTLAQHRGIQVDATSIDAGWSLSRAQEALQEAGLSASLAARSAGGRPLGRVFCAPIFFMRLKHLAVLKCHARHDGPLDPLFRQPQEALAQGGGLRLGEMEVSALVSHGAADLVQMLLHDQSDGMQLPYCSACHKWAETVGEYVSCRSCLRTDSLVLKKTNCAFKYLEESLALLNLKLVQCGAEHTPGHLGVQHEDSDLSSMTSGEEEEWLPQDEEPRQGAMEAAIKASWRDALMLGVGGAWRAGPAPASASVRSTTSKDAWNPPREAPRHEDQDEASSEAMSE